MLPQSVLTSVATPHLGQEGLGFIKEVPKKYSLKKKHLPRPRDWIPILYFFRMGKQPVHIGGKGVAGSAVCSPPRGKTCCLEIAKVKRMGFKVFAFKQTSDEGELRRVRYVYASEEETITCRKKLLRRPREERAGTDLSAMIDDETVFGAELVNDLEVTTAVASDDAMSETTETLSTDSAAGDDVFVPLRLGAFGRRVRSHDSPS